MTKAQHTPGPWKTSATTAYWIIYDPDSKPVATTLGPKLNKHAKSEANARLIAAAPELLAVLQELEESAGYWSEYDVPIGIVDRIRAAIAKATGEP